MNWKNKKVLVTGGAGVIGRELIKSLVALKADILCIDREPKPERMSSKVNYCKKDISKMDMKTIMRFDPEIIFHLAASFERTEETAEFWDINFRDNIIVSHRIIEVAGNLNRLRKFILASSYLIYSPSLYLTNNPAKHPFFLKETDYIDTRNLTGAAKFYAEKELEFINATHRKFNTVLARIFRVYGLGSRDVISRWVRMALKNEELAVFQEENIFDYIYAQDVAMGLIKMAESIDKNVILNLGTGSARKVKEVLDIIKSQTGKLNIAKIKKGKLFEASCADMSRFRKLTGWQPEITLEEGIKRLINYEKDF